MSLMKTLAKVAIGVAVAKGVSSMTKKAGSGSVLGQRTSRSGGGIEDLLGSVLSGRGAATTTGGAAGGLGGLLESLSQASRPTDARSTTPSSGSLGDLLNQSLDRFGEPETTPSRHHEEQAGLMLKAMLQAAKSDGKIDAAEKEKLLGHLGTDITPQEIQYVNDLLAEPVDVDALAKATPRGMESQIYLMSVMGIDLDNRNEAQYLHQLASALGIDQASVNHIHDQLGAPALYS
ncbi:DUF533 domain-containing protein [Actibacterium ureilyticum]|uniref:DUF533 domain-containing protein n=1 Tax=Actibacterium ureilyticum TaxID=1590614 RepID=UPI000BAA9BD0|nr:DUF533 domain-containing protein [Actibacterium ureilyticum]